MVFFLSMLTFSVFFFNRSLSLFPAWKVKYKKKKVASHHPPGTTTRESAPPVWEAHPACPHAPAGRDGTGPVSPLGAPGPLRVTARRRDPRGSLLRKRHIARSPGRRSARPGSAGAADPRRVLLPKTRRAPRSDRGCFGARPALLCLPGAGKIPASGAAGTAATAGLAARV